jgi:hypothetical protein
VTSRARELAGTAVALAAGAGVDLPDSLALWRLAGGRPSGVHPEHAADPAAALGEALERRLGTAERRRGAHYTPPWLADEVVQRALPRPRSEPPATVCDPACGAGAMLLAAGRHLVAWGRRPELVARELLWGADLDPLGAAVAEAAVALWSRGVPPAAGHVVAGDALTAGRAAWPRAPASGFGAVAGNPPFQGQLAADTARSRTAAAALRARFGPAAAGPYVDTAALFLLLGTELTRPGGRVALVQPLSVVAARDASPVRDALAATAALRELYVPPGRAFPSAAVRVCVPVLEVGAEGGSDWPAALLQLEGTPQPDRPDGPTVGSVARCIGSFRDEYYGLVPHVREADGVPSAPLVTCGLLEVGRMRWGERPVRFAKRTWQRPVVDLRDLERSGSRAWRHVCRVQRPKVVVASQTRVAEAAPDHGGTWIPSTPAVSVVPEDPAMVGPLTAALCSPPVSAWLASAGAGTGLADGAFRVSADRVDRLPLPVEPGCWSAGTAAFERWVRGEAGRRPWAEQMTAAYGLHGDRAEEVVDWWAGRLGPLQRRRPGTR